MKSVSEITALHLDELDMGRGLKEETVRAFGIVSAGDRIAFPYSEGGEVRYYKSRDVIKKDGRGMEIFPTGKRQVFFNFRAVEADKRRSRLYITEGEFDCMAVSQALPSETVVSVPGGANGFAFLFRDDKLDPMIDEYDEFVLCPDNDADGKGLDYMHEMAMRLGRERCLVARMPDGFKDANEILTNHPDRDRELARVLNAAKHLVPRRLMPLVDIPRRNIGPGLPCHFRSAGERMKMVFPSLITVTGTPNSGKSQFTVNWCLNLSRFHGVKCAFIKFEDEVEDFQDDVMSYAKAFNKSGGALEWARKHVISLPLYGESDDLAYNLKWLDENIREAACVVGCKVVVVDPWNQMEHFFDRMTESDYTLAALAHLGKLARKYQIAIIVVNHPTKAAADKEFDDLSMYDVAGSAHWANRSDMVLVLGRQGTSNIANIKIAKARRQSRRGPLGSFQLCWNEDMKAYVSTWRQCDE